MHLRYVQQKTISFYSANPATMAGPALGKLLFLHCKRWRSNCLRGTEGLMWLLLTESFPRPNNWVSSSLWLLMVTLGPPGSIPHSCPVILAEERCLSSTCEQMHGRFQLPTTPTKTLLPNDYLPHRGQQRQEHPTAS